MTILLTRGFQYKLRHEKMSPIKMLEISISLFYLKLMALEKVGCRMFNLLRKA